MSNKTYNILKHIALIYLPAVGTLYLTLAGIWGLPYGEQKPALILITKHLLPPRAPLRLLKHLSSTVRTSRWKILKTIPPRLSCQLITKRI